MVGAPGRFPVIVVGGGQAGLAMSYELTGRGVEHVVLERAQVGQMWRGVWGGCCLGGPGRSGDELRADRPRGRACGAGTGAGRADVAGSVGQLLPGDAELDDE